MLRCLQDGGSTAAIKTELLRTARTSRIATRRVNGTQKKRNMIIKQQIYIKESMPLESIKRRILYQRNYECLSSE